MKEVAVLEMPETPPLKKLQTTESLDVVHDPTSTRQILMAKGLLLLLLPIVVLQGAIYSTWVPDEPRSSADSPALLVHVLPASELSGKLIVNAKDGGAVATSRAQFAALFTNDVAQEEVAAVYVETAVASPLDLEPNLVAAASPPPAPPPPSTSPSVPPPSPTPAPPAPHTPVPWWVAESRLPSRPRWPNASLPAADAPGHWAYEVLDARPGTVLLANPAAGGGVPRQPYFDDAVILLVATCGCHPNIFGVVLSNPPSNVTVGATMCPVARARYHSFASQRVRAGGPAGPHYTLLHAHPLAGDMPVAPGLRVGGCLAHAQALVDAGALNASDVSFFSGYAAWPIARLAQEIADGRWRLARASSDLLLDGVRAGTLSAAALAASLR